MAYFTLVDNIIIMGYPATGIESLYRNDRSQVRKFLEERYTVKDDKEGSPDKRKWWIFNLYVALI
jgi:hypothetical protein